MCIQKMNKSSNLRIRVEPELHQQFLDACKQQDIPAAQVLREYMQSYVRQHYSGRQIELFKESDISDNR